MEIKELSRGDLIDLAGQRAAEWDSLVDSGKTAAAKMLAAEFVGACRSLLENGAKPAGEESRRTILVLGIAFRGLYDFCTVAEITSLSEWKKNFRLIEKARNGLCDCRERISYSMNFIDSPVLLAVLDRIKSLENDYLKMYGPGLYLSSDMLIKRPLCSICRNDPRSCEHVIGEIYGDTICAIIPQDIEPRSLSLVSSPADPRCRIWPWRLNSADRTFKAMGMTTFQLADFNIG